MRTYYCLIVDDETLAQNLIETHLAKIPNFEVVAKCHTAMEAMQTLNEYSIDLMFLDIEMPDLTGLEMLRSLEHPPFTILTTAYAEYALESYELNVVDYLLKPVRFDRFFKSMTKAIALIKGNENEPKLEVAPAEQKMQDIDYIFVKSEYKAIKIRFDEIEFIESQQKYVRYHLDDKKVTSLMSLGSLLKILPKSQFFRCQKSFIINLNKIEGIDGNQLVMSSGTKIPISKSIKTELIKNIDHNNLL